MGKAQRVVDAPGMPDGLFLRRIGQDGFTFTRYPAEFRLKMLR